MVVNTSFNVRGEPIVCTPTDAFKCFMGTDLDMLTIGNYLLYKEEQNLFLKENYEESMIRLKKLLAILFVFLQILVIEIFLTFVLYHWYKDRSEQPLLDHPLAIISTLKIINAKFEFLKLFMMAKIYTEQTYLFPYFPSFVKFEQGLKIQTTLHS